MKSQIFLRSTIALLLTVVIFNSCTKDHAEPIIPHSKITVRTLAGSGIAGFADGDSATAQFNYPRGVACDAQGNVYVADALNNRIRKITAIGVVTTLAGTGAYGSIDGKSGEATFQSPEDVAIDLQGNIYVADALGNRIRKITTSGVVSTIAGNGIAGFADGNGMVAQFLYPRGIACDLQGNIYVAEEGNNRIRKITADGMVSTYAGTGIAGFADGNAAGAQFSAPMDVAIDAQGNVYVTDEGNQRIRKITTAGQVITLAGNDAGYADGNGSEAKFQNPRGITLDAEGNMYVADGGNNCIRKITAAGMVSTLAGNGIAGNTDGDATVATFSFPTGVAIDVFGHFYVADNINMRIRKITIE
ncbi:MAG: hypothetical protein LH473_03250 [Chitinophagales bacterium]|nr:hypothetical protein [Chitinophagales bacterium]